MEQKDWSVVDGIAKSLIKLSYDKGMSNPRFTTRWKGWRISLRPYKTGWDWQVEGKSFSDLGDAVSFVEANVAEQRNKRHENNQ